MIRYNFILPSDHGQVCNHPEKGVRTKKWNQTTNLLLLVKRWLEVKMNAFSPSL